MRLIGICVLFTLSSITTACAQEVNDNLKYLAQTPPGISPEVYAPGLISLPSEYEFGSVFNKDATEFYYAVELNSGAEIRYTALEGGQWSAPVTILTGDGYGLNDPFLSPDETRLYFISTKALEGPGAKGDYDIWYVEQQDDGWSDPINAGPQINSKWNEYYISFTDNGTMYFGSNKPVAGESESSFDIFYSKYEAGAFQPAVQLGGAINTEHYEADVFVAPDESYLIFCATRPGGLGRGDLYVSFKKSDGSWTKSISMGKTINTQGHELCPFVSADGKYFFYTSKQDIYWVSTEILTKLRPEAVD